MLGSECDTKATLWWQLNAILMKFCTISLSLACHGPLAGWRDSLLD